MLKINNLKDGDIITVDDDGLMREGTVVKTSPAEHQALVDNGIQEFWYDQEDMHAVPLDENQLTRLGFTGEDLDGGMKYKRDSFRVLLPEKGNFSKIEMWWREDRRHFDFPLSVHQFQNLYLDMTKVHLDKV